MRSVYLLLLVGCGGTQVAEVRIIEPAPEVLQNGPKPTREELSGEAPALRGLKGAAPLVPPKFVPPEPPADPKPDFQ